MGLFSWPRWRDRSWLAGPQMGAVTVGRVLAGWAASTPYRSLSVESTGLEPVVVAITEATLSGDRAARAAFWDGVRQIERDLPNHSGLIGYSLRRELLGKRVWTLTTWASAADLRRFAASPVHRNAMAIGSNAASNLRFARLTRAAGLPPLAWADALAALSAEQPRPA